MPVRFDIQTLETLGVLDYADALPKNDCWESAHPHHDAQRQETINFLIDSAGKATIRFIACAMDRPHGKSSRAFLSMNRPTCIALL